jgi:hypothetical protein
MNEKDLLRLREDIARAKSKLSELRGKREYLMQELKKNWDIKTVEAAEIKMNDLTKELTELTAKIKKGIEGIDQKYSEGGNGNG